MCQKSSNHPCRCSLKYTGVHFIVPSGWIWVKSCIFLPAARRRTQFFLLIFTEPGAHYKVHHCTLISNIQGLARFGEFYSCTAVAYHFCLGFPEVFTQPDRPKPFSQPLNIVALLSLWRAGLNNEPLFTWIVKIAVFEQCCQYLPLQWSRPLLIGWSH